MLGREALLRGAGVVAGPVEALGSRAHRPAALRLLADLPVPVASSARVSWDPSWTDSVPLLIDAPTLSPTERTALWTGCGARDAVRQVGDRRHPAHISCSAPVR